MIDPNCAESCEWAPQKPRHQCPRACGTYHMFSHYHKSPRLGLSSCRLLNSAHSWTPPVRHQAGPSRSDSRQDLGWVGKQQLMVVKVHPITAHTCKGRMVLHHGSAKWANREKTGWADLLAGGLPGGLLSCVKCKGIALCTRCIIK